MAQQLQHLPQTQRTQAQHHQEGSNTHNPQSLEQSSYHLALYFLLDLGRRRKRNEDSQETGKTQGWAGCAI